MFFLKYTYHVKMNSLILSLADAPSKRVWNLRSSDSTRSIDIYVVNNATNFQSTKFSSNFLSAVSLKGFKISDVYSFEILFSQVQIVSIDTHNMNHEEHIF